MARTNASRTLSWRRRVSSGLDVAGKSVSTAAEMRKALADAKSEGKHDVLIRVKTANNTHYVAMPIG